MLYQKMDRRKPDWNLLRNTVMNQRSSGAKKNLYQSDGKAKVWRKKASAHDPKHTYLIGQARGSVMGGACSAAFGECSLNFIDDVT